MPSNMTSEEASKRLVDEFNREVARGGTGDATRELAREIGGDEVRESEARLRSRRSRGGFTVRQPTKTTTDVEPEDIKTTTKTDTTSEDVSPEVKRVTSQRDLIAERIRTSGATPDRLQRFYEADITRQRLERGEEFTDFDRKKAKELAEQEFERQRIWYATRDQVVSDLGEDLDKKFKRDEYKITGVFERDLGRDALTRIKSKRDELESRGDFIGRVGSGVLAVPEIAIETARGIGVIGRGVAGRFEQRSGVLGFFPSPKPEPISLPTRTDIETIGSDIGASLTRDPIKGGVLVGAEIATFVVPVAGVRGVRLFDKRAPSPLNVDVPTSGRGFTLADEVGSTVVVRDGGSLRVTTIGGQVDLTGGLARRPDTPFRTGDFIPIQDPVTGRLKWLPPNSPELRTTVFTPTTTQQRFTGVMGDPVVVRDTFTGRTTSVDASVLPDFLSEQTGRFTVVGRPVPTTVTSTGTARQTSLVDSSGGFAFAMPFPVPVGIGSTTVDTMRDLRLTGVTRTPVSVSEARGVTSTRPTSGITFEFPRFVGVASLGTQTTTTSAALQSSSLVGQASVEVSEATTPITGFTVSSASVQQLGQATTPSIGTATTMSTRTTPLPVISIPQIPVPTTPSTPARPPARPVPPLRPFALPTIGFDTRRTQRTSTVVRTGIKRFRGVRTASPSRGFILNPFGTVGGVRFVRGGKEVDFKDVKKKKVFDTNFMVRFGGIR